MAKTQHTHKFKRLKYKSGNITFFCTLPDCTVKINPQLALGKRSICWRCGSDFILNEYALRLAKPHCPSCHKPKHGGIDHNKAQELINTLPSAISLAERLQQTLTQALPPEIEEEL